MRHKSKIENLYRSVKFPDAIDWWSAHHARDKLDVAVSNARHLDPTRQSLENDVWRRVIPVDGRILDLACGGGFFSNRLSNLFGEEVEIAGVDLSETVLRKARTDNENIPFLVGRGEKLPFGDQVFDTVLVIAAFEHIEDEPDPVIDEIYRVLKPGGCFYLSIHKPCIDPFIVPAIVKRALTLMGSEKRPWRETNADGQPKIGYKHPLKDLRRNLKRKLLQCGFAFSESRCLIHQFNWWFYRMLSPRLIPPLIRIGGILNRLPFDYYKNQEYWLLKKRG